MKLYFELKTRKKADKQGNIRAVIIQSGQRATINTNLTATKTEWKKGHLKNIAANATRKKLLRKYETAYDKYITNSEWTNETATVAGAKEFIEQELNKTSAAKKQNSLNDLFELFQAANKTELKPTAITQYQVLINHIHAYKPATVLADINEKWINGFKEHLSKEQQKVTINKSLGKLKAFCRWAYNKRYTTNTKWQDIKPVKKVTAQRIVVLTKEELTVYYQFDFKNARLERARDLACFSGFTGLRFKDLTQVSKETITEEAGQKYILINTHKTGTEVKIPLNKQAIDILNKYEYQLPSLSNQKLNEYIKEGIKKAGINSKVSINIDTLNGTQTKQVYKHQVVSIHDFRKSFITICLANGLSVAEVMRLSTHSEYNSFKVYINFADTHLADKINSVNFIQPPQLKKVS